jgi:hypothetical protein
MIGRDYYRRVVENVSSRASFSKKDGATLFDEKHATKNVEFYLMRPPATER